MGYSANSAIIYGFKLSEEDQKRDELWDILCGWKNGETVIQSSGDSRSGMHSPCIGVQITGGDSYSSKIVEERLINDMRNQLKKDCKEYDIEFQEPKLLLITWTG